MTSTRPVQLYKAPENTRRSPSVATSTNPKPTIYRNLGENTGIDSLGYEVVFLINPHGSASILLLSSVSTTTLSFGDLSTSVSIYPMSLLYPVFLAALVSLSGSL